MFVDFTHLSKFNFESNEVISSIVKKFVRYEEDMRVGLTKFIDLFKIRDLKTGCLG
jgi:hypothetical protein